MSASKTFSGRTMQRRTIATATSTLFFRHSTPIGISMDNIEIKAMKEAKRKLYLLILIKGRLHPNDLTSTEIEIGFNLSMDEQMQEILSEKVRDNE